MTTPQYRRRTQQVRQLSIVLLMLALCWTLLLCLQTVLDQAEQESTAGASTAVEGEAVPSSKLVTVGGKTTNGESEMPEAETVSPKITDADRQEEAAMGRYRRSLLKQ
ncbi:hypothetical protein Q1695_009400 [Nippostrongylus brasiliensis]|nr:hypothetical protein Q1695_009400 [Nippostrongylus brasiliensis]